MTDHEFSPIDPATWLERLRDKQGLRPLCYAMYSSFVDGVVTDPRLMMVPVDDHMVHRGDAVFETLKCVDSGIYNLRPHIERLMVSATGIGLTHSYSIGELEQLVVRTTRVAKQTSALIRILLSRGTGSMGVNPYDCVRPELYIIVSPAKPSFMERKPTGAQIAFTRIPAKPAPFAAIKHCNYLPNAMMAKEAADRAVDFVISCGADGRILEGPTENIALITADNALVAPDTPDILPGTTLARLMELASSLKAEGLLRDVRHQTLYADDVATAREIFIAGTSHDIIAVTQVDQRLYPIGPIYQRLHAALQEDIRVHRTAIE